MKQLKLLIALLLLAASAAQAQSVKIKWKQIQTGTQGQVAIVGVNGTGEWVTPPFLNWADTTAMLAVYVRKATTITINGNTQDLSQNRTWTLTKSDVGLGNVQNVDQTNASNLSSGTVPAARMPAYTGDVTSPAGSTVNTIANNAVTNAKAADMAANTIKGNNTGSTADPKDLTVTETRTLLNINNVDNTSDANKPISTATQTALNGKLDKSGGTMTGYINLHADASSAMNPVTYQQFQNALAGLTWKQAVEAASIANVNITTPGFTSLDGVTLTTGTSRVLLKDQSTASQNGIYIYNGASAALTRATDLDNWSEVPGAAVFVENGTVNARVGFTVGGVTTSGTIGTTAMPWTQFTGAGQLSVTAPITLTGNTIGHANSGVSAGTYSSVTVDAKGHVTAGTNPGYLTTETDPIFVAHPSYGISSTNITNWNTAYTKSHDALTIGTANGLSLSGQQLSLATATTTDAGAMSAADKTKLNGIAAGAQPGTITSVGVTVPTGLQVSGSPLTGTGGTIAITNQSGYSIPTDANQTNWTGAYNDVILSASVTGTTTKTATLVQRDAGTITFSWTDLQDAYTDEGISVTGGTSNTIALPHTPSANKHLIVQMNGVTLSPNDWSMTGATCTLSNITREASDYFYFFYSY